MDQNEYENYLSEIPVEQILLPNNITEKFIGNWILNSFTEGFIFNSNGTYSWGKEATSTGEKGKWYIRGSELFLEGIISDMEWSEKRSYYYQFNFIRYNILILTSSIYENIERKVYLKK
ncbi:MAG: hypothetical protein LBH43_10190 [Treponema sp.]|jgi:hypothetical protein|nr:hypothetical protein [Treponema sp.]